MRALLWISCAALVLAACDAPAPAPAAPASAPTAVPDPPPAPAVPVPVVGAPAPVAEAPLAGVGPGGAEGRAARRQAVLDILADGRSAAALELIAADPTHPFDLGLGDALTPTTVVRGPPAVRQRAATVTGPLDKDIVRRIVRAHINEVRYCYNQGLAEDPWLGGHVTIDFSILTTGSVGEARVARSTVPDPVLAPCIATAIQRWKFPKPATVVKVSYPFELAPAG